MKSMHHLSFSNYAKAMGAFYAIGFAAASVGSLSAGGVAAVGGQAFVETTVGGILQSTVGSVGGALALEGSQHVLGLIGGYDRNTSGEKFSIKSYYNAGLQAAKFGFVFGVIGRLLSPGPLQGGPEGASPPPSGPAAPPPPPEPAAPEPVAQTSQQYRIGEGVRRAVAHRELGFPDVEAVHTETGQPLGRISLGKLLSPKGSISRDPRFLSLLRGVGGGNPPGAPPVPPIEVAPVPPEGGSGLTPVPQVRLLRWRPQ